MGFLLACPFGTCVACSMMGKIGGDAADQAMAQSQRRAQEDAERARAANAARVQADAVREQAVRAEAGARLQRARVSMTASSEKESAKAYREAETALEGARREIAPLVALTPPDPDATALGAEISAAQGRILLLALDDARRIAEPGQVFVDAVAEEDAYITALNRLDAISGPPSREFAGDIRDLRGPLQQASRRIHRQAEALRRRRQREAEALQREATRRAALALVCGDAPPVVGTHTAAYHYRTVARDPDSVEVESCGTPRLGVDHCWLVVCDVRARNGFGGMTRNAVEFEVGREGRLMNIRQLR